MKKLTLTTFLVIGIFTLQGCGEKEGHSVKPVECNLTSKWKTILNKQPVGSTLHAQGVDIVSTSDNEIFAVGYGGDDGSAYGAQKKLITYKSSDSGTTWTKVDGYQYADAHYTSGVAVVNDKYDNIFVLASGTNAAESQDYQIVRRSVDKGKTWDALQRYIPGASKPRNFAQGLAYNRNKDELYSAGYFLDTSVSMARPIIQIGTNLGMKWEVADSHATNTQSNLLYDIEVDSNDKIFAVGAFGEGTSSYLPTVVHWLVRVSVDNGATWFNVDDHHPVPDLDDNAFAIYIDNENTIFVGGYTRSTSGAITTPTEGYWTIRKSTDGGGTWENIDSYQLSEGKQAAAAGITKDLFGNLYVVGYANDANGVQHWIVRKSEDNGVAWAVTDDFVLSANANSSANKIATDYAGNLYVIGYGTDSSSYTKYVIRKLACE